MDTTTPSPDPLTVPPPEHPTDTIPAETPIPPDVQQVATIIAGALSNGSHVINGAIYDIAAHVCGNAVIANLRHVSYADGQTTLHGVRLTIEAPHPDSGNIGDSEILIAVPKW